MLDIFVNFLGEVLNLPHRVVKLCFLFPLSLINLAHCILLDPLQVEFDVVDFFVKLWDESVMELYPLFMILNYSREPS